MGNNRDWRGLGVRPADILLPQAPYFSRFWPVVALDQYTSQPEVWKAAEEEIGSHPSTLRLIVPEAFLEEAEERSRDACRKMAEYLEQGLFAPLRDSFVLVERSTQSGRRVGLVLAVDLEDYDYQPGSASLIRATEETVLARIPPRLKLREESLLELSHVLLLIDDPGDSLLGPLYQKRQSLPAVYDTPLLMKGGHIRGWQVADAADQARLMETLRSLKEQLGSNGLLFAVGDGNHSLAAAKAAWEKQKAGLTARQRQEHPMRYALAELVNLHSPALLFEPIHRMAFGTDRQRMLEALSPLEPVLDEEAPDIVLTGEEGDLPLALRAAKGRLLTQAVQQLLDEAGLPLDYVHGSEALREIAAARGGTGILMPDFPKEQLFPAVRRDGRLPRKTFSMGEANEKRFYLEIRRIK